MSKVYLISEDVLKNETILNDNVGSEYIGPAIETSQDIYLQQLIGTALLDKLYDDVANDTLTEPYRVLIDDYITNYLKYKVLSEVVIPLSYKYSNVGMVQAVGDHSTSPSLRDAQLVQNHYELRATFYADRMTRFLDTNSNTYPEWRDTRNNADIVADSNAYKTNWTL